MRGFTSCFSALLQYDRPLAKKGMGHCRFFIVHLGGLGRLAIFEMEMGGDDQERR